MSSWDPASATIIFERLVKKMLGMGRRILRRFRKASRTSIVAQILNDNLKGRKFVTGNTLTLADFSLGAQLNLAQPAQIPLGPFEEIKGWDASLMEFASMGNGAGRVAAL